jgi:hypothetical protein
MSALPPGAVPIGRLDALPPLQGLAVRALRRWCEAGSEGLAADLDRSLGADLGPPAALAFDALCRHCLSAGRHPLLRHGGACPCLGADEAAFAQLVHLATDGEREDALMLACCLVRPDLAPALVHLAQAAGLALRRALVPRGAALH